MADDRELRALIADLQTRVAALENAASRPSLPSALPSHVPLARSTGADEAGVGLKIVNRLGAITLAVGIVFFFKYAADNQWIGPAARVGVGVVAGAFLLAVAEWFVRKGQTVFAQGLQGCGLAALYISVYAAFGFYKLLGAGTAFLCMLLLCGGVVAVAVKRRSAAVAILGLAGALLTPQLVELAQPATWRVAQSVYLVLLQSTAVLIASLLSSRVLVFTTASLVTLTSLIRIDQHGHYLFVWLMLALAALHFAAWFRGRSASTELSYSFYLVGHCFFALGCLRTIANWIAGSSLTSAAGSIFLAVYGVALLARGLSTPSRTDRGLGLVFLGLVITKLYLVDIWNLAYATRITAFVALGILLLLASFLYSRVKAKA